MAKNEVKAERKPRQPKAADARKVTIRGLTRAQLVLLIGEWRKAYAATMPQAPERPVRPENPDADALVAYAASLEAFADASMQYPMLLQSWSRKNDDRERITRILVETLEEHDTAQNPAQ